MELLIPKNNNMRAVLHELYAYIAEDDAETKHVESVSDDSYEKHAERLLDDYGNSILRLAYSYLHNMSDAEDVLQDTLIRYLKAAPNFRDEIHEKRWLLRVAGNISKNRIDYNNVRQSDELSDQLEKDGRDDLAFVWDAVKALPVKYREVIHLYYYEGYQTSEIAALLKEKDATIRSRLDRGRDKLKNILKEAYDFG